MQIKTTNPPDYPALARVWMSILAHKAGGVAERVRVERKNKKNNEETKDHSPDPSLGGISSPAGDRGRR